MDSRRPVASGPGVTRAVAALLAPSLGWTRSHELVAATLRRLCLDEATLEPDDARLILADLALEEGMVGVTARIALSRSGGPRSDGGPASTRSIPPPASVPPDSSSAVLVTTIGLHEITAQLAPLLGAAKTESVLNTAVRRLGLPRERLDREQAGRLLDDLGHQDGVVGMTVRFARGRVMARFGG
jgi:hypothetical protein